MSIPAHIARLRAAVGHDLLLLPSISVLPVDQARRLLLVRHAGHDDGWGVLGGAVEPGESPAGWDRGPRSGRPANGDGGPGVRDFRLRALRVFFVGKAPYFVI